MWAWDVVESKGPVGARAVVVLPWRDPYTCVVPPVLSCVLPSANLQVLNSDIMKKTVKGFNPNR